MISAPVSKMMASASVDSSGAMYGAFWSGRSATRSISMPTIVVAAIDSSAATGIGSPDRINVNVRNAPSISRAPCAKLMMLATPKTRLNPSAIRA